VAGTGAKKVREPDLLAGYGRKSRGPRARSSQYVALLGLEAANPLELIERVRKGLSFSAFAQFQKRTALSTEDVARLVDIPIRTLNRRKAEGRLRADESDRLVRASRVVGGAIALFEGDVLAALRWLGAPQVALGGRRPIEIAGTDVGAREIEALVGRIEHGIPS